MKISFLGDSITYGHGIENQDDRFSALICKQLGAEEANFGIPGTLMARAGVNRKDGNSFVDRLDLVLDGDITVIFGGTNDYFWGDTPIGDIACDLDGFYRAVDEICKKTANNRDVSKTLVVTPYPHNGIGNFLGGKDYGESTRHDTNEKNFNGHSLEDYVNVLEEVASRYEIPVLNLHKISGFDWEVHTSDGCHPNNEGHKWLAEQIGKSIMELL